MPLWHTSPGCLAHFRRRSSLPQLDTLVSRLYAHIGIIIDIPIITHARQNCKRKWADLLRPLFNFWNDSGNPAKVIKGRFRHKLRAYNAPLVVLVKHITIFALEVARLSNKSIIHGNTSIYLYFDASGCLSVCNLFLFGDAQAPTMQGRL